MYKTNAEKKIWIAAIGCPATGKTTLLKRLVEAFPEYSYSGNDQIITEGTILNFYHKKLFIENDHSFFFRFQMEVLPLRFSQSENAPDYSLVDETIFSTLAYTKALLKLKWIKDYEYHTFYQNYLNYLKFMNKPAKVLYLKCDTLFVVLSRIARRGRQIEKKYSIEYIEALQQGFAEVAQELIDEKYDVVELNTECCTEDELFETIEKELTALLPGL
ncbi:MAG: deoxynucleoside kinase [Clostridia bacterium]|nr:deoxynucleoside kinase [Clostridia bacterium]